MLRSSSAAPVIAGNVIVLKGAVKMQGRHHFNVRVKNTRPAALAVLIMQPGSSVFVNGRNKK